jgi:hypothetical protein
VWPIKGEFEATRIERSMSVLLNWKHEKFAQFVADGIDPRQAYTLIGYAPNRANHNRLLRRPEIAARIAELKHERMFRACAAKVPVEQIIDGFGRVGVNVEGLFERNAAGVFEVRDLRSVPAEVALALLRSFRAALGIPPEIIS